MIEVAEGLWYLIRTWLWHRIAPLADRLWRSLFYWLGEATLFCLSFGGRKPRWSMDDAEPENVHWWSPLLGMLVLALAVGGTIRWLGD